MLCMKFLRFFFFSPGYHRAFDFIPKVLELLTWISCTYILLFNSVNIKVTNVSFVITSLLKGKLQFLEKRYRKSEELLITGK